jgi:hypothetical protein
MPPRRPRSPAAFEEWLKEAILEAIDHELAWWAGGELREVRRVPTAHVERFKVALATAGEGDLARRLDADIKRAVANLPPDPAQAARREAFAKAMLSSRHRRDDDSSNQA